MWANTFLPGLLLLLLMPVVIKNLLKTDGIECLCLEYLLLVSKVGRAKFTFFCNSFGDANISSGNV